MNKEKKVSYVFDTSCFIENPFVLSNYDHKTSVIPVPVLEELDNLKVKMDHVGKNARAAIHYFENCEDIEYCFPKDNQDSESGLDFLKQDNRILSCLKEIENPILVTKDLNLKVKAKALGYKSEHPSDLHIDTKGRRYTGVKVLTVSNEQINNFYQNELYLPNEGLSQNEFVVLKSDVTNKKSAIGRFIGSEKPIKHLTSVENEFVLWSLKPRNMEQKLCADVLLDPKIKVVSLIGIAGSGKTLLAVAAGLQQVFGKKGSTKLYKKMIISRPIQAVGADIGFLPGTLEEKMSPWIQPIMDNLDFLTDGKKEMIDGWFEKGKIEVEALTYIRGRSLPNVFIIIDEAQNLTSHEIKTILTRVGENSKIILTGDVEQIDNFKLTEFSNGLSYAVEKFRPYDISAHIELNKGERSEVAELAANIL